MSQKDTTTRVNIRIPNVLYDYYKSKSDSTGVSMSALMYLDLENYLMMKKSMDELPALLMQMQSLDKRLTDNK
jgi:hypothetical protein